MKNQSNKHENTHAHHEKHEAHAGTEHKFAYAFTHVSCFSLYFACCSSCFFMCLLHDVHLSHITSLYMIVR